MALSVKKSEDTVTVVFSGDIGFSIWEEFKKEVLPLEAKQIVIEFAEASSVCTSVVGMMLHLKNRRTGKIHVKCGDEVRDFFECIGCAKRFSCNCALPEK